MTLGRDLDLLTFVNTIYGDTRELPALNEAICLARPYASGKGFRHVAYSDEARAEIEANPGPWYVCVSTVRPQEKISRKAKDCSMVSVVVLDDIGTKAKEPPVPPTFKLETSEGNFQWGYVLEEQLAAQSPDDVAYFDACMDALTDAGYGDKGAKGVARVFRIPGSINTKEGKNNWATRVTEWEPSRLFTLPKLMEAMGVDVEVKPKASMPTGKTPDGYEDPVLKWIYDSGLATGEISADGWHTIACPWGHEHTHGTTAGYVPAGEGEHTSLRGFKCFHDHCADRNVTDFLQWVEEQGGPKAIADAMPEVADAQAISFAEAMKKHLKEHGAEAAKKFSADDRHKARYAEIRQLKVTAEHLPDQSRTEKGGLSKVQPTTEMNVRKVMSMLGISCRQDMMRHTLDIRFTNPELHALCSEDRQIRTREVIQHILDECLLLGMKDKGEIRNMISDFAYDNMFHPVMEEVVLVKEWDGLDRIAELARHVPVKEDWEDMAQLYLRKWAIQGIQAWNNYFSDPQSIRCVLVLQGAQNIRKSRFAARFLPRHLFEGDVQLNLKGEGARKDSIMHMTTTGGIVELAELDTTFSQSEHGALKAVISATVDTYRAPYDRRAISHPRCVLLIATVNTTDFSRDETGSTRFWALPVGEIPESVLEMMDAEFMQQFWAQAYALWKDGEQWWLSKEEDAERDELSVEFRSVTECEEKLIAHLETRTTATIYVLTASEICTELGVNANNKNLATVRRVMDEMVHPRARQITEHGKKRQNVWRFPMGKDPINLPKLVKKDG